MVFGRLYTCNFLRNFLNSMMKRASLLEITNCMYEMRVFDKHCVTKAGNGMHL